MSLYLCVISTQENIDELNYTMQRLEVVLSNRGLKMNVSKTQILCRSDVVLPPEVADLRLPLHLRGVTPNQEPPSTDVCLGAVLQLPGGTLEAVISTLSERVFKKLRNFDKLDEIQVSLHLQHLIFQTSVIPSLEYMFAATWVCHDKELVQVFYNSIRHWYIQHFFPPGAGAAIPDVLAYKSGPLTKAQVQATSQEVAPCCQGERYPLAEDSTCSQAPSDPG